MESFEKFAHTYGKYNVIQKKIIKKYLHLVKKRVIDLGCGSEGLCKYKDFEFYLGIDKSYEMLKRNPCNTMQLDFNEKRCFEVIKQFEFDQIVSFSALQWAKNLDFVFREIKNLNKEYILAIFTSNTFKTLHNYLEIDSPIFSKEKILKSARILNPETNILKYKMEFNSAKEMLEYIKFSGVKGDVKAPASKIRRFLKEFPFNYLEFEVIILNG
ncbi:hypothetical protein JCM11957_13100 [Caminibacter profundus]